MIKHLRSVVLVLLTIVVGGFSSLSGQVTSYTPKQGLAYIKAEDYTNAELVYKQLLKKYPKDGAYNFYMGICLLYNKGDLSTSIKMLNYARLKKVSRKVFYYLGRAHQLAFHFDEAIANFNNYLKSAKSSDSQFELAKLYIEQSRNARSISSKIYNLEVIDKSKTIKKELLEMYYPAKDVGRLYKNSDFFESGVNPHHIMFETERGDVVYFSMASNKEDTLSIFKMEKLLDGWGDSHSVGAPVNSVYNDAYPFLGTDGLTLYFSSDRPGGFGGFDIYKAYFDNESHEFLEPINMGVPFNSPDDDFMFVSDGFNQVAWFASNRETVGDTIMVYTVKWDGKQVRNMVENLNQISEAAKLKIGNSNKEGGNGSKDFTYQKNKSRNKITGTFNFEINDTIVYTEFDHFLDTEALELFRSGYKMSQQKDSLASMMKSKRVDYAKNNNHEDRSTIVNEIIRLENKVYNLEDNIEEKYMYARQKELHEIQNQLRSGSYNGSRQTGRDKPKSLNLEGVFVPEKYTFHTSDEFERHYARQKEMYDQLFSKNDLVTLRYADSLYVWANILNLESARLLEKSTHVNEVEKLKIGNLLKRTDTLVQEDEEATSSRMINESKELKLLSNRIYHKALDKKYVIYYLKLKDISGKLDDVQGKDISMNSQQAKAYYREAKEILSETVGLSVEEYEKAGMLKKAGVEKQEKALKLYCDKNKGELAKKVEIEDDVLKGKIQKSYAELHKGNDAYQKHETKNKVETEKKDESENATSDVTSKNQGVFKIQIGVFRNSPKKEALDKIPKVSKIELEGRGLTKYFAGSYKTYEGAQNVVPSVVEAGFAGAFVVYFKNGKICSLPEK